VLPQIFEQVERPVGRIEVVPDVVEELVVWHAGRISRVIDGLERMIVWASDRRDAIAPPWRCGTPLGGEVGGESGLMLGIGIRS
jgi:hypothetical protein